MGDVLDGDAAQVISTLLCEGFESGLGCNEHRLDQAPGGSLEGGVQREGIAGVDDGRADATQGEGIVDQAAGAILRRNEADFRDAVGHPFDMFARRNDRGVARNDGLAVLVGALAAEGDVALDLVAGTDREGGGNGVAHQHGCTEVQSLAQIDGAWPGKAHAEHGGNLSGAPHAVRDHGLEDAVGSVCVIDVLGIEIAGGQGEQGHVLAGEGMGDAGTVAHLQFVEGAVVQGHGLAVFLDGKVGAHGDEMAAGSIQDVRDIGHGGSCVKGERVKEWFQRCRT